MGVPNSSKGPGDKNKIIKNKNVQFKFKTTFSKDY
jgi:hypothetical protein